MRIVTDLGIGSAPARPRAGWSPARLFRGGAAGAWYDPGAPGTIFQDAAGTTPAAVGDPVGLLLDMSGNGNHASQSVSAARPTLQQGGDGRHHLEFDGVDDVLRAPFEVNHTFATLSFGYQASVPGENGPFLFGAGFGVNRTLVWASFGRTRALREPVNGGLATTSIGMLQTDTLQVVTTRTGPGENDFLARANQVPATWEASGAEEMDMTGQSIAIGGRPSTGGHAAARFWGGLYITRALSDAEMTMLEAFLAEGTGVTLP